MKHLRAQINESFKTIPVSLSEMLDQLVAEYFVFAQNIRGMHWNMVGPGFLEVHETFGEFYEDINSKIDAIAERIRQLSQSPPTSAQDLVSRSTLTPVIADNISIDASYVKFLTDADAIQNLLHSAQELAANSDEGTNSILSGFIVCLEKQIWLVKSNIE